MNIIKTKTYQCSYIKNKIAKVELAQSPVEISQKKFSFLMASGFRRSGSHTYRPICKNCSKCIPIRIPTQQFSPNRTQRKTFKNLKSNLTAKYSPLEYSENAFLLFENYQRIRHPETFKASNSRDLFENVLLKSCTESELVYFFDKSDQLKLVSVIDVLTDGFSSVYTFYDTNESRHSLGTYSILWQLEECKLRGKKYLYLGYLIKECGRMQYKTKFRPCEVFLNNEWVRFDGH
tara:strand:- start:1947 stop:2648 length:702 start_codon:yes stop_codon:yes gene_type:complete